MRRQSTQLLISLWACIILANYVENNIRYLWGSLAVLAFIFYIDSLSKNK